MRLFYRSHLAPAEAIEAADSFFTGLGLKQIDSSDRTRTYSGTVGYPEVVSTVHIAARAEGGHYTFVEITTDQIGESRIDRNAKRFLAALHRSEHQSHAPAAAY